MGCLFLLMLLAAVTYFGFEMGEPYWRYYRYLDTMQQAARFAETLSDQEIILKLHAKADSLGLPQAAYRIRFNRTNRAITISADYYEIVRLPRYTREIHFQPRVEAPL
jgi:hypothetical protein